MKIKKTGMKQYNLENKKKNDEINLNQIKEDVKALINNNNLLINNKINDEKIIIEIKEKLSCFLLRVDRL